MAPTLTKGTVEQAIFTWSSRNIDGRNGQGFGAATAELKRGLAWLRAIDNFHFSVRDPRGSNAIRASGLQATGVFRVGDLNIVYRKEADAGLDARGRPRSLAHVMVGRADEFDIATLDEEAEQWLAADECPLDGLPPLERLDLAAFVPRDVRHVCREHDPDAEALLRSIMPGHAYSRIAPEVGGAPRSFASRLLTALPARLWPEVEFDWFAGQDGHTAYLRIGSARPDGPGIQERVHAVGLSDCVLHRRVEEAWAGLPQASRTWARFIETLDQPRSTAVRGHARAESQGRQVSEDAVTTATAHVVATIGAGLGRPWDGRRILSATETYSALYRLQRLEPPAGGWVRWLPTEVWISLVASARDSQAFRQGERFFRAIDAPYEDLLVLWDRTGLAVVGYALLQHADAKELPVGWAVPKTLHGGQLVQLVGYLARTPHERHLIGRLFEEGFAGSRESQQCLTMAIMESCYERCQVFNTVLPQANLPAEILAEILIEHAGDFIRCARLAVPIGNALELALARGRAKPKLERR